MMVRNRADFLDFVDAKALIKTLAMRIRTDLVEAIQTKNGASLIVSGGATPMGLFEALSHIDLPWEKVTVGLVDERWVDVANADSNEKLVRSHLLKDKAARAQFIGMKTKAESAVVAEGACDGRYEKISKPFDLVLLGMGTDGHTASWIPGADRLEAAVNPYSRKSCVGLRPAGSIYDRLTLTLPMILNAHRICVHIEGDDKRKSYEKAAAGGSCQVMPIRYILGQNKVPVTVFWAP